MLSNNRRSVPLFKENLRVSAIRPDGLAIISERRRSIINGRNLVLVAQTIDGLLSVEEIVERLRDRLAFDAVLHAINQLESKGYLRLADSDTTVNVSAKASAFWESLGLDGRTANDNLTAAAVSVQSLGGVRCEKLIQALASTGIRVAPEGRLKIVVSDDYLRPELSAIARLAAQENLPLLLVKASGTTACIGPLIRPQDNACLACLQFWVRSNRPLEHFIAGFQGETAWHLPLSQTDASEQLVCGFVAAIVGRLFAAREDHIPLAGGLLAIDFDSMQTKRHAVTRRPQCPVCGDADWMRTQAERFPVLQPVRSMSCRDGGYRRHDPLQIFEKYRHLISPLTGALAYLHPMPGRHAGLRKVYVSGYLVCPQDAARGNSFDKICAGKGQTDEQARTSALCEGLERYSGVHQGDEASMRGCMRDFDGAAIHFNALQNFSERQFRQRDEINALTDDPRQQIPLRFDEDALIDWTPAWSLASGSKHYVPLSYCYAESPAASGRGFGIHNPNGTAAGNGLEEAILQGFLELVERDATAIWWYGRIVRPRIDLASFGDAYFDALVAEYAQLGWQLWVLDLTHDLGIPTCAALAWHAADDRYAIGFGCHLNARIAMQRALTEVNQLFDAEGGSPAPWDRSLLPSASFLHSSTGMPDVSAADFSDIGGLDLRSDIAYCVDRIAAAGMDFLVVDKTRPDIGLSVVQVIVPGLRHFWPRFGAGRLYSVPLRMGWGEVEAEEHALNPAPLFL